MRFAYVGLLVAAVGAAVVPPGGASQRGIVLNAHGSGIVVYAPGAVRVGTRVGCADGARTVSGRVPRRGGTVVARKVDRHSTLTLRLHDDPAGALLASCRVGATVAKPNGWLRHAP